MMDDILIRSLRVKMNDSTHVLNDLTQIRQRFGPRRKTHMMAMTSSLTEKGVVF